MGSGNKVSMISIGVWVDLKRQPSAGGHVKCWEKFAEAATTMADQLDLTVHFLGDQDHVIPLASNVRYVLHRPRFSTERLPFLKMSPAIRIWCPITQRSCPIYTSVIWSTPPIPSLPLAKQRYVTAVKPINH